MLVRFDPSLSATLDMAIGQGLAVVSDSGSVKLTAKGAGLADAVLIQNEALVSEKNFLAALPNKITQAQIQSLLEWS